ncbi:MAG TPA: DUF885 domain-containing protein [Steroidobacteraceae bacterium]|nr:DUF885 domain-containing protein [Steroidobacteraceae bacterium]
MRSNTLAGAAAALTLFACGPEAPPAPAPAQVPEDGIETLEHDYAVFVMERFPVVATYLGGSQFAPSLAHIDARLRDYSPAGLRHEAARLADFRERFMALDSTQLSAAQRIDRDVALAQIAFMLRQQQTLRHQQRALDSYVDEPFRGVDWQIQGMTAIGPDTYGTPAEWKRVVARARAVAAYLQNAEGQLRAGVAARNAPDWRVLREYGLASTTADAEYFSQTLPAIAAKALAAPQPVGLLDSLQQAGNEAAAAYLHLRAFVVDTFFENPEVPGAAGLKADYRADHFAAGEAEYDWALHNNLGLEKTAAELFTESWPVVERTRASMIELAAQIARTRKWNVPADGAAAVRAVFEQLSRNAPRNDDEMIEGYRKTAERLVNYARATGLFDVPSEYRLDVTVTPPPLRSSLDGAAYYPAPPFKKAGVGRFYVTPTGNDRAALRNEHNFAAMPDLAAHEGFPGHDWHYKVMTEYRGEISPVRWLTPGAVEDSSSMWEDSVAAEGWALYSEALLSEPQPSAPNGFYTPEERLYQLRGQLYRDLRVRIDTGIHTGRMQFEEAVTLFSETVDFLPGSCTDARALQLEAKRASCESARRAVTRYSRWPTQAVTYRLGKDQILELRKRAQAELADAFSLKRFHLEFMKQGTVPTAHFAEEVLRALRSARQPEPSPQSPQSP